MIFTTLNTIIEDLLLLIRGAEIAYSEPISKRHIEAWRSEERRVWKECRSRWSPYH